MRSRTDSMPSVSVVIPVLNEESTIEACLRSLSQGSDAPDEIVVVDNGCVDRTVDLARSYGARVVRESNRGVSFARTTGFDAAEGEIIARIDADSQVAGNWVRTIRRAFHEHPEMDAVGGGAAIAELSPRGRFWFRWWYRGFRAWHERSIAVSPMLYGFNSAFRRTAWERARHLTGVGDESVSDDVDVTIALLRTGHRLDTMPELLVKARLFRSIDRDKLRQYYLSDNRTLTRHQYGNPQRWCELADGSFARSRSAAQTPPTDALST